MAAQRHHLRPEPFNNALIGVPGQRRGAGGEGEALRHGGGERPAARVMQGARRDGDVIDRFGIEFSVDPKFALAAGADRKIVQIRGDPQGVAGVHDVQRLRRFGELQADLPRLERVALPRAADIHRVALRMAVAGAAGRVGQDKRRGAAQPQFKGRVVQPRRVGQAQPQRSDTAIRDRLVQHDQVGLLVRARGALHRADGEILRGQHLRQRLRRRDTGLRPQFDGQQPGQGALIDRLVEGQRDGVEIGAAVGVVAGGGLQRHRQQRHQRRRGPADGEGNPLQRLPRLGRAELQRARPQPLPGTRLGGGKGQQMLRRIFRPALGRTGIGREQHGHRVPAAQEAIRHHLRPVGPLQPVERRLRVRQRDQERGCQQRQQRGQTASLCVPLRRQADQFEIMPRHLRRRPRAARRDADHAPDAGSWSAAPGGTRASSR